MIKTGVMEFDKLCKTYYQFHELTDFPYTFYHKKIGDKVCIVDNGNILIPLATMGSEDEIRALEGRLSAIPGKVMVDYSDPANLEVVYNFDTKRIVAKHFIEPPIFEGNYTVCYNKFCEPIRIRHTSTAAMFLVSQAMGYLRTDKVTDDALTVYLDFYKAIGLPIGINITNWEMERLIKPGLAFPLKTSQFADFLNSSRKRFKKMVQDAERKKRKGKKQEDDGVYFYTDIMDGGIPIVNEPTPVHMNINLEGLPIVKVEIVPNKRLLVYVNNNDYKWNDLTSFFGHNNFGIIYKKEETGNV